MQMELGTDNFFNTNKKTNTGISFGILTCDKFLRRQAFTAIYNQDKIITAFLIVRFCHACSEPAISPGYLKSSEWNESQCDEV
jgi:hypothetical protein